MTYDEWKAADGDQGDEPDWYCPDCGHDGEMDDACGCFCCTEPEEGAQDA